MGPRVDGTSPAPIYDYAANLSDTHVVQVGETSLRQIADKLHLDPDAMAEANPQIKDGTKLLPLQVINLPQSSAPPPAAQQASPTSSKSGQSPAPLGDPVTKAAVQATLEKKGDEAKLPVDERYIKDNFGDAQLRIYRDMKQDLANAHHVYETTGKIPPSKYSFAPIEIKTGTMMTKERLYDDMMKKRGHDPSDLDVRDVDVDPDYMTQQDFDAEHMARAKQQGAACEDDYTRPDKRNKCVDEVAKKAFPDAYQADHEALKAQGMVVQRKMEGLVAAGAFGVAGRVIGRGIGYLAGNPDLGEDIGAAGGDALDAATPVVAGKTQMNRNAQYENTSSTGSGKPPAAAVAPAPTENAGESQPNISAAAGGSPPPPEPTGPKGNAQQQAAYANTEPQVGGPPKPPTPAEPAKAGNVQKGQQTVDTNSPEGPTGPAKPASNEPTRTNYWNDPKEITVNTSNGPKKMTLGDYRGRVEEARQWISKNGPYGGGGPAKQVYDEAADRFGLDHNWQAIGNPNTHRL